jgi:hypothetical protein
MRHLVTTEDTEFSIINADGTLIFGSAPAGTNISTGQDVCDTSADGNDNYYTRLQSFAIPWEPGMVVKSSDNPISYDGKLYRVIQDHTTQADWTPDIVQSLYVEIQAPGSSGYPDWVQPTGGHDAYNIGDRVSFNGSNYESKINANVWSPAVYPAGWITI